jgi:hypothetical protein
MQTGVRPWLLFALLPASCAGLDGLTGGARGDSGADGAMRDGSSQPPDGLDAGDATVLFFDDFEGDEVNQPPTGWVNQSGTWIVTEDGTHVASQTDPGPGFPSFLATAGDAGWTDYTISVRVKPSDTGSNSIYGLATRAQAGDNSYSFFLLGQACHLSFDSGGTGSELANHPCTFAAGTWYTLALAVRGGALRGTFDGIPVVNVTDGNLSGGAIGIRASVAAEFDDVLVTSP